MTARSPLDWIDACLLTRPIRPWQRRTSQIRVKTYRAARCRQIERYLAFLPLSALYKLITAQTFNSLGLSEFQSATAIKP
jgi:hypothetical protein